MSCAQMRSSRNDLVVLHSLDAASPHGGLHVIEELLTVPLELLCCLCLDTDRDQIEEDLHDYGCRRTFVQGIVGVWFKEEVLQSDHDGVQVQNWLPVFSEDVQADVALKINVWVVNLGVGAAIQTTIEGESQSRWDIPPACTSPLEAREGNLH